MFQKIFCYCTILLLVKSNEAGLRSYFYNYFDEIAISTCTALSMSHQVTGHVSAVRRECSKGASCSEVCQNAPSTQFFKGKWSCFDALHVYKRPGAELGDNYDKPVGAGKVGLYTYRYGHCGGNFCGPNYCCCIGK